MQVQRSISIDAPPESVWKFVSDPEMILEWYLPLRRFEYTSDLRQAVGAPFVFEEQLPGRSITLECVVTEWNEPERVSFEMTSGPMMRSYGETWTVERIQLGSEFTFTERMEFANPILRSIGPLIGRMSGATVVKMLAELRRLAES
jgi:uncharacterized protein YndB with AHSA1/START domain